MLPRIARRALTGASALALIALGAASASASGLDLAPATDAELGEISWQGAIISPDFSYDTLDLGGAGAAFLEDPEGFRAGGEVGYDWQRGSFLFGVVGDATYSWIEGDGRGAGIGQFASDLNYMGTLRGRLGVAFGRVMLYGTGGWAFGKLEVTDQLAGVSDSNALSGWAAGGGLEYVWNQSITLRAEYIHLDYGTETYTSLPAGAQDVSAEMGVINLGLVTRY
jgi:outer membrane immunogenic protein